jgi:hypothetical protein
MQKAKERRFVRFMAEAAKTNLLRRGGHHALQWKRDDLVGQAGHETLHILQDRLHSRKRKGIF